MANSSLLDASLIQRAAPEGSMRYFALLYTPRELRDTVTALYVIDAEIRESAQSVNHDVAHTRLQWWRQEIDRLARNQPQHPATQTLAASQRIDAARYARLHELLAAADMDLARMTYANRQELRAYSARSGGMIQELIAALLLPAPPDEAALRFANRIGSGIRQLEILRDVRQDAYDGRLYVPLDELADDALGIKDLRAPDLATPVRAALARGEAAIAADLNCDQPDLPGTIKAYLRPLFVLAALHRRLLARIAGQDFQVGRQRIELGPLEKPWIAWRAARRAR